MGKSESDIRKQQTVWMMIRDHNEDTWLITSKLDRTLYYLWKNSKNGYQQIAKNRDPGILDDMIWKAW